MLVFKIRHISASRCVLDRIDGKCERRCVGIPQLNDDSGSPGGSSSSSRPCGPFTGELPPGGNCFISASCVMMII